MKNSITIILLVLFAGLLAGSCSITKRRYMPGYYVHNPVKSKHATMSTDTKENRNTRNAVTKQTNPMPATVKLKDNNTEDIVIAAKESDKDMVNTNFSNKQIITENALKPHQALLPNAAKPTLLKYQQKTDPGQDTQQAIDDDNSGLKTVGWVLIALGLLVLLFASILAGAVILLLGLIFVVSA